MRLRANTCAHFDADSSTERYAIRVAAPSADAIVVDVAFIGADNSPVNHADAVAVTGAKRRAARATVACADAAVVGC